MSARTETTEAKEAILGFVRGSRSWRILEKAGIYVELKDAGCEIDNPWKLVVKACLRDVAQGLLVYHRKPDHLQRWASIILAGSSFLDLGKAFETTAEGDILLNALWDASFGEEIDHEALSVAEALEKNERLRSGGEEKR